VYTAVAPDRQARRVGAALALPDEPTMAAPLRLVVPQQALPPWAPVVVRHEAQASSATAASASSGAVPRF
jgi:hypothetical protein